MAWGGKREGSGRKPGSVVALNLTARELIQQVANDLGGAQRMREWAQEDKKNESDFWVKIYPRLAPIQVQGDKDNPLQHNITVEIVTTSNANKNTDR